MYRGRIGIHFMGMWPVLLLCMVWPQVLGAQSPAMMWDKRYSAEHYIYGVEPVEFLKEQIGRLGGGRALCLAAGEGRNAVYLAERGFAVMAVDISARGLEKARALANKKAVKIETVVADLDEYDMGREQYDLVTDFYYHDPKLFPRVMAALKPGGFFILQNFSVDQPKIGAFGPKNPSYLVGPNELLRHFSDHRIRLYEDVIVELDAGMHKGAGAVVRLLVEKTRAQ